MSREAPEFCRILGQCHFEIRLNTPQYAHRPLGDCHVRSAFTSLPIANLARLKTVSLPFEATATTWRIPFGPSRSLTMESLAVSCQSHNRIGVPLRIRSSRGRCALFFENLFMMAEALETTSRWELVNDRGASWAQTCAVRQSAG